MEYKYEKLTEKIIVCASSDHRFGTDAFLLADFSGYRQKDVEIGRASCRERV